MKWSQWSGQALGTGTEVVNTCVPSCAAGKLESYPVIVVLWRVKPLSAGANGTYYTRGTAI